MPDFSAPEYASYVTLCRDLRIEREYRAGDWRWWEGRPSVVDSAEVWGRSPLNGIWILQIADWLSLLEVAGRSDIGFEFYGGNLGWACGLLVEHECAGGRLSLVLSYSRSEAPTREEAAARLWMAVTGR